jgi:hypothetical protein
MAFDERGLIREVSFDERGLIREVYCKSANDIKSARYSQTLLCRGQ